MTTKKIYYSIQSTEHLTKNISLIASYLDIQIKNKNTKKLILDGQELIDMILLRGPRGYSTSITLKGGRHEKKKQKRTG